MQPLRRNQFLDLDWDADRVSALGELWRDWFRIRRDGSLGWSTSACQREYRLWGLPAAALAASEAALRGSRLGSEDEGPLVRSVEGPDLLSLWEAERAIYAATPLGEWLPFFAGLAEAPCWLEIRFAARSRTRPGSNYLLLLRGELAPAGSFRLRALAAGRDTNTVPLEPASHADPVEEGLLDALATREHVQRQVWMTAGEEADTPGARYSFQPESAVEAELLAVLVQQLGGGGFGARVEEGLVHTDLPLGQLASLVAGVRHPLSLEIFPPSTWPLPRPARDAVSPPLRALYWRGGFAGVLLASSLAVVLTEPPGAGPAALLLAMSGLASARLLSPPVARVLRARRAMEKRTRALLEAGRWLAPLPAGEAETELALRKHSADARDLGFTPCGEGRDARDPATRVRLFASEDRMSFLALAVRRRTPRGEWWPAQARLRLFSYLEGGLRLLTTSEPAPEGSAWGPHPVRVATRPDCRNTPELWEAHRARLAEARREGARVERLTPEAFLNRRGEEFEAFAEWRRRRGYSTWAEAARLAFAHPAPALAEEG